MGISSIAVMPELDQRWRGGGDAPRNCPPARSCRHGARRSRASCQGRPFQSGWLPGIGRGIDHDRWGHGHPRPGSARPGPARAARREARSDSALPGRASPVASSNQPSPPRAMGKRRSDRPAAGRRATAGAQKRKRTLPSRASMAPKGRPDARVIDLSEMPGPGAVTRACRFSGARSASRITSARPADHSSAPAAVGRPRRAPARC